MCNYFAGVPMLHWNIYPVQIFVPSNSSWGHNTEQQTWDYIHEVIDAEERKNRLKGGNLLGNSQKPHKYALDAV